MQRRLTLSILVASWLAGCGPQAGLPTGPTTRSPSTTAPTAPAPPGAPVPSEGINGRYRGDFAFTERDTKSCGQGCWPAQFTVIANLRQNGNDVAGDFDIREVIYSGGEVKGTVETAAGDGSFGTFKARFEPNDLGVLIVVDSQITASDGSRLMGTFVFGQDALWRGTATFTRLE